MRPPQRTSLTFPPFTDQMFEPTESSTATDKAGFANTLCRFIKADFPQSMWKRPFYQRLSNTFGHIAHCDIGGFWETFFADYRGKVEFIEAILQHACYGDPRHTHSDVERAVQPRLHRCNTLDRYRALRSAETEGAERALLERLRAKYEGVAPTRVVDLPAVQTDARPRSRRDDAKGRQQSLI